MKPPDPKKPGDPPPDSIIAGILARTAHLDGVPLSPDAVVRPVVAHIAQRDRATTKSTPCPLCATAVPADAECCPECGAAPDRPSYDINAAGRIDRLFDPEEHPLRYLALEPLLSDLAHHCRREGLSLANLAAAAEARAESQAGPKRRP